MAGVCGILLLGGVTVWELQQRETPVPPEPPKKQFATIPVEPPRKRVAVVVRLEHPIAPVELPLLERTRPSEAQLFETEVEVWWLLHRAGACHGEPIEIRRTADNRIAIGGVAPTRRRRQELVAVLEGVSERDVIRVELEAAEDLQPMSSTAPRAALPMLHSGPSSGASEFQITAATVLHGMYPADTAAQTKKRLVEIGNLAIRRSEDAIGEALAIRRLGNRFRDGAHPELSAQSRQSLELMAREHLLALHSHLTELGGLLAQVLSNEASRQVVPPAPFDLTDAVERLRILVQGSLSGNSSSLGTPAEVTQEIAAVSERLTADLSELDSAVARVFRQRSDDPR